jgi:hypothetical protein
MGENKKPYKTTSKSKVDSSILLPEFQSGEKTFLSNPFF